LWRTVKLIIVKVEGCGICAGDLKCQHGAAMFWGDEVQPAWVKPSFIAKPMV
jgi:L-iditol 2-dehydrogenase